MLWNSLRRWAWMPSLAACTGLLVACGDSGSMVDMPGERTDQTIETVEPAPPGAPSTDMGGTPAVTTPPGDYGTDQPALAPAEPIESTPADSAPAPTPPAAVTDPAPSGAVDLDADNIVTDPDAGARPAEEPVRSTPEGDQGSSPDAEPKGDN